MTQPAPDQSPASLSNDKLIGGRPRPILSNALRTSPPLNDSIFERGRVTLTPSGRTAILRALHECAIGPGDKVLVPSYHCPTMIEPIVLCGGTPVFYPLRSDGSVDIHRLEAPPSGTRAMLVAHFFGIPLRLDAERRYCDVHGLSLIEDCAHAFRGEVNGQPVGSWGDFVIGSLPKFFGVREGGCLVERHGASSKLPDLSRASMKQQARALWHVIEANFGRATPKPPQPVVQHCDYYKGAMVNVGRPKPTILPDQLGRTATWITRRLAMGSDMGHIGAARRHVYELWNRALHDIHGLRILHRTLPEGAIPYVMPVLIDVDPHAVYQELRAANVPVNRWDIRWPDTPVIEGDVATQWSQTLLQLPCHQDISQSFVEQVADFLQIKLSKDD